MHFDDRLATVLRSRTGSSAMAKIQFRQLLDLLGTLPVEAQGAQVDAACERLGELAGAIDSGERARMLRDPGTRLRNPSLIAFLAHSEPAVAVAAIESAQLSEEEWIDLAPALPAPARMLVRRRRDLGPRAEALFDRLGLSAPGLPPADIPLSARAPGEVPRKPARPTLAVAAPPSTAPLQPSGIGAIVQRIEDFRKARAPASEPGESALVLQLPFGDEYASPGALPLKAFDFATDGEGSIVWSDPGVAPMAIGLRLISGELAAHPADRSRIALALRWRQPIRGIALEIAGAPPISGRWIVDAAPAFEPRSGAFTGYAGRMRRAQPLAAPGDVAAPDSDADRMRQLLHELRTPVNAIQGFAEVIQQQMFGPAPHEYRSLAAGIAADAALILAGFEELDRLARLDAGALPLAADGSDLSAICAATIAQLEPYTAPRNSGFILSPAAGPMLAELGRSDAERLVWRLLASLAATSAPGENLAVELMRHAETLHLVFELPATLAALDDDALMHAAVTTGPKSLSSGFFGTGFTLRLAAAEARAAGGAFTRHDNRIEIDLPGLTTPDADHSGDETRGMVP